MTGAAEPERSRTPLLHRRAGTLANGPWAIELSQSEAGWSWASLRVLSLGPGASHTFTTGDEEVLVMPLSGSCTLSSGGVGHVLRGRSSVFAGLTDFAYVPGGSTVQVTSEQGGRFAVPGTKAEVPLPLRYQPADQVPVEYRGAANCSRRVVNYCMPGTFPADRLLVCEVFTPGGNWSSYPPHKHDQSGPDEAQLEEIYYFEVAAGPSGEPGPAYQRVYGTPARPIELLAEVGTGDVVLIPHGYHGPSMAAPGYDLYYLNVMAGPGQRAWRATDDPAHAWIRATWAGQVVDPRARSTVAPPAGGE